MNVIFDFKIALAIVSLIIAFGIFFYNPMVYHARMLKLQKKVDDLHRAVRLLALEVELQKIIIKSSIADTDTEEEPKTDSVEEKKD